MADVGIDLTAEGWVAEAQPQAGTGQIVQQLGRRNARDVLAVKAEGLNDGIALTAATVTPREQPLSGARWSYH